MFCLAELLIALAPSGVVSTFSRLPYGSPVTQPAVSEHWGKSLLLVQLYSLYCSSLLQHIRQRQYRRLYIASSVLYCTSDVSFLSCTYWCRWRQPSSHVFGAVSHQRIGTRWYQFYCRNMYTVVLTLSCTVVHKTCGLLLTVTLPIVNTNLNKVCTVLTAVEFPHVCTPGFC